MSRCSKNCIFIARDNFDWDVCGGFPRSSGGERGRSEEVLGREYLSVTVRGAIQPLVRPH